MYEKKLKNYWQDILHTLDTKALNRIRRYLVSSCKTTNPITFLVQKPLDMNICHSIRCCCVHRRKLLFHDGYYESILLEFFLIKPSNTLLSRTKHFNAVHNDQTSNTVHIMGLHVCDISIFW